MILRIQDSYVYTDIDIFYVNSYVQYIIELLKIIIIENNLQINIIIGNGDYDFIVERGNNSYKIIKININWEHTLVKQGGRGTDNYPPGKILTNEKDFYIVRFDNCEKFNDANIIIDYSIPNIYNIYKSKQYDIFFNKMVYISPVLFNYNIQNYENNRRQINVLTTFINTNEPRIKKLLDDIKLYNLNHENINNCFDNAELEKLYLNTKILINIHQTNEHHTFEELRVLPALLTGVLVISEISPLNTLIPYNDLIIWSSYDKIIETTNNVINNYEYYHNKIFKSKEILSYLHQNNIQKMKNKLDEKLIVGV